MPMMIYRMKKCRKEYRELNTYGLVLIEPVESSGVVPSGTLVSCDDGGRMSPESCLVAGMSLIDT